LTFINLLFFITPTGTKQKQHTQPIQQRRKSTKTRN